MGERISGPYDFKESKEMKEEKIEDILTRGVAEVINRDHLRERLLGKKKLRIKLGIDPTGPDIHIGRASTLKKLRMFQDLGHKAVLIIGDFTAQIGDSSDKPEGRKGLTQGQIDSNLENYLEQIGRVVDISRAEIRRNSEWLGKLSPSEWVKLAGNFTVQKMISRDNFATRIKRGTPVSLQELLYPLAQGYDSVVVKADVELGGTDQTFNLHAGRKLQQVYGQEPQDILMMQLMIGPDGRKMSTSWGNVIKIVDLPENKYGKIMSIADQLIPVYMEMLTDVPLTEIHNLEAALSEGEIDPMKLKKRLAKLVVQEFDGNEAAEDAQKHFESVVQRKEVPSKNKILKAEVEGDSIDVNELYGLIKRFNLTRSKGEARRILQQGGIYLTGKNKGDEDVVIDKDSILKITDEGITVRVGKRRFLKIVPKK